MHFLVNDSIITAVSWTLIHSLWLGLAAAILAGLVLLLTKKSTSGIRYNLLAVLTLLFVVAIGFTFYYEFETKAPASQPKIEANTIQPGPAVSVSPSVIKDEPSTVFSATKVFISDYGSWIVLIWFVVFVFKCIRMTGAIREVYRVRNYQTISPPEIWQKRLSELQVSLRIKRSVQLLESGLVTVPSVTGFFKPIILMPVGLLNNIPQDQVEAILLHELAHIRRSDYAVNLMQTFLEILFFFNPGVLWISSLLKDERENCCDDLAIGVTNNKKEFVNALISFQEYHMSTPRFSMQFGDQKMKLADRAKRILFNTNKMLSNREKYFLSACAALSVIVILVVLNVNSSTAQTPVDLLSHDKYNPKDVPEGTAIRYVDDTNGKKSQVYVFKNRGVLYQVPADKKHFKVDGKLITGKDRENYLPQINELIANYEKTIASDISEEERIIDEASGIIDKHTAIIDEHTAVIDKHTAVIDEQVKIIEAEINKKESEIDWKKHYEAQRRIEAEQLKINTESAKIDAEARKIDEQARKIDAQSRKIEAKMRLQEKEFQRQESLQKDLAQKIMNHLRKAGYKEKIDSFELNDNVLIVNGKTQSESLFKEVKKHLQPGMRITYHTDTH